MGSKCRTSLFYNTIRTSMSDIIFEFDRVTLTVQDMFNINWHDTLNYDDFRNGKITKNSSLIFI